MFWMNFKRQFWDGNKTPIHTVLHDVIFHKSTFVSHPPIDSALTFLYTLKALSENAFILASRMSKNRPPTIADVAHRANVSIATVSRVLNGTVPVHTEKADRVRLAMDELQFVPRHAARVLASRRTNTIGLLLPEISGAFFSPLLKGIEAGTHEAGYDLLVHSTQQTDSRPRRLGEHNTDGLLIFTNSLSAGELHRLHSLNFPIVLMHQTPPDSLNIPSIAIENKNGAAMLIDHLIEEHDRRRIVYLRGEEGHEDSFWRELGYREALKKHKIKYDPALVASGNFDEGQAFTATQKLLAKGVDFDAVFAGDDDSSIGVIRALRLAGRIVPQDVAVVGFDDLPFARYFSPALTTVRAPIEQVGREAARQLICLINGQQTEILTLLRTELVIRESCGCLPTSTSKIEEAQSSTRR